MAVSSGGRDIDVTIFGATGFTGQHIVAEAVASLPADTRWVRAVQCSEALSNSSQVQAMYA